VPIEDWFIDQLGDKAEETLLKFCSETDFFDPNAIKSILKTGSARQIWYLLNFALWWNEFIRDTDQKISQ
jgi:asparagine synthase (glutamine-hydrolysing)